ncbi:MAG: GGDEF domain-containing response regulator [Polyangia bacterium]
MSDGKRIVLIDTAATATDLAERLRMQGYTVTLARHPSEGARLALSDPPSAVVADLWMPSISGVQLCRLLKAEPATSMVPVILRGPDAPRNHFWSERAGASDYVAQGRMGDLVRTLDRVIAAAPPSDGFFTTFSDEDDIRERIAARLDAALFESVLAAEVRALGTCGEFNRLFDLFSQFAARVTSYRWLAVSTVQPVRFGLHTNPNARDRAEREAAGALGIETSCVSVVVQDEDAFDDEVGPAAIIMPIELGGMQLGKLALAPRAPVDAQTVELVRIIARELAGPIRMATLVEESQRLARIDALTGLLNRRALATIVQTEVARSERYAIPFSFVLLDVDHFKSVNDERGHAAGDAVLAAIGKLLPASSRPTDSVGRWGGEEFVVALSHTNQSGALIAAERLRAAVEGLIVPDGRGGRIPVTASFGVACLVAGDTLESLVDRADRAMYAAKVGGRNRVVVAASDLQAAIPAAVAGAVPLEDVAV